MKNKVLLLAVILTLGFSANAFAAFAWINCVGNGGACVVPVATSAPLTIKPSANVNLGYDTVTGISYSLGSFHTTGTMSYATSSTDTNIYRFDNAGANIANTLAAATPAPSAPATATSQIDWTAAGAWTASK